MRVHAPGPRQIVPTTVLAICALGLAAGCGADGPGRWTPPNVVTVEVEVDRGEPEYSLGPSGDGVGLHRSPGVAESAHVWATIDGRQRVRLLIDTGTARTTLFRPKGWSEEEPDAFPYIAGGSRIPAWNRVVRNFQVGEVVVGTFPIRIIEHANFKKREFDGLLGADFLFQFTFTIDIDNKRMTLVER